MRRDLYKKILIATDGSENDAQAINAEMEIARLSEGKTMLKAFFRETYPKK